MNARLPTARYSVGVAVTASRILIFGGFDLSNVAQILSYDPAADVLIVLTPALNPGREGPGTFLLGGEVYLLGGSFLSQMVKFDPLTSQLTVLPAILPYAPFSPPAFTVGQKGYLYGSVEGNSAPYSPALSVIEFDPSTGEAKTLPLTIPQAQLGHSTASMPTKAYIFGGLQPDLVLLDTVIRFTP